MVYKKFKPFINDFVVCLIIMVIVIYSMTYLEYITIHIKPNLLTITLLIILCLYLIKVLNNTIVIGLKGLVDYIFKKSFNINATYISYIPLQHSIFSTKISKKGKRIRPMYYMIVAETNGKVITMVSSEYVDIIKGKEYNFKLGFFSHILISVE